MTPVYQAPLYCALHVLYVPVRVARGAFVAHRYTYMHLLAAEPRSAADFYSSLSVSVQQSCRHCI